MDERLKPKTEILTAPTLPARTDAQFLAQLPEFAEGLLYLSEEYEVSLLDLECSLKASAQMRSWCVLESLAQESLLERARLAAQKRSEEELQKAKINAQTARPTVPRHRVDSAIKSQALKALDDPNLLQALKQWSQSQVPSKR
ncbi:MAG: hypothetical protein RJB38_1832 [Pseudomonadota bacterium]|jgi:hypothetical protein